jgi:hypothetical protein
MEGENMKTRATMRSFFCLAIAAAMGPLQCATTVYAKECSNETLNGTYGFRVSGMILGGTEASPTSTVAMFRDGVALTTFDGQGGLTQEDFVLGNGVLTPGPTDKETGFHDMESGTYTVHADCTGTFTINMPVPPGDASGAVIVTQFVLTNKGNTIHTIVSSLTPPNGSEPVPTSIHSDGEKQ